MALGLNIVVGFAGLLDLGYVAFFAIGAYTVGWFGSGFYSTSTGKGIHVLVVGQFAVAAAGHPPQLLPGAASRRCSPRLCGRDPRRADAAPARRLHRDRDARVRRDRAARVRVNGERPIGTAAADIANGRQGITPVDNRSSCRASALFSALDLRPVLLDRARDGADRAVRQRPPARLAARPRVDRAARGRGRGRGDGRPARARRSCWPTRSARRSAASPARSWARTMNTVNADQFEFGFSIFVLAMIILGGLGNIWGVVLGARRAVASSTATCSRTSSTTCPRKLGLDFDFTEISFGDLRLPAGDHDDAAARGPAAGAAAQDGARTSDDEATTRS